GAPVIAVTGQVEIGKIGTGAKQYMDQQTFFRPLVATTGLVLGADAALNALVVASVRALMRRNVSHLSIPKDVLTQPVEWVPMPLRVAGGVNGNGQAPMYGTGDRERASVVLGDWGRAVG